MLPQDIAHLVTGFCCTVAVVRKVPSSVSCVGDILLMDQQNDGVRCHPTKSQRFFLSPYIRATSCELFPCFLKSKENSGFQALFTLESRWFRQESASFQEDVWTTLMHLCADLDFRERKPWNLKAVSRVRLHESFLPVNGDQLRMCSPILNLKIHSKKCNVWETSQEHSQEPSGVATKWCFCCLHLRLSTSSLAEGEGLRVLCWDRAFCFGHRARLFTMQDQLWYFNVPPMRVVLDCLHMPEWVDNWNWIFLTSDNLTILTDIGNCSVLDVDFFRWNCCSRLNFKCQDWVDLGGMKSLTL